MASIKLAQKHTTYGVERKTENFESTWKVSIEIFEAFIWEFLFLVSAMQTENCIHCDFNKGWKLNVRKNTKMFSANFVPKRLKLSVKGFTNVSLKEIF